MDSCSSDRAVLREPEAACPDRELLELAALAAGLPWEQWVIDGDDSWNPRINDGDALRLAVKLAIDVTHYPTFPGCYEAFSRGHWCLDDESFGECDEPHGDDPCAATRLAIVRAAAAIGSELRKTASGCSHTARSDGAKE